MTSFVNWEATDAISWNSCYVYVCSCALNTFKAIEGVVNCEIQSVIRFLNARNVLPSEIHHQICQVYGDNVMSDGMVRKRVRMLNEGQENVHDEARSGHTSTDISQFLICPYTFLRFQWFYSMTLSAVANIIGGRILWGRYKNLSPATISASIMAANMWKNSLKNVECDNNLALYNILLEFFYIKTVLFFWISLRDQQFHIYIYIYICVCVCVCVCVHSVHGQMCKKNKCGRCYLSFSVCDTSRVVMGCASTMHNCALYLYCVFIMCLEDQKYNCFRLQINICQ